MGYAAAKSASPTPEEFGKGKLEGVAAAEAANNAVNGPTLVPLLTLGIPGDNLTVILVGAFIAQGLRPGPQLMEQQGPLVFAILIAMVIANVLFLGIGKVCIPFFAWVVTMRKSFLLPITLVFAFAGTWIFRGQPSDLAILVIFGAIGYICKKLHFDVTPMAMGFILGPTLEYSYGQSVILAQGELLKFIFIDRPITAVILILTPLATFMMWKRSKRLQAQFNAERE
jgi:putative tricarboxylic transport membrane protein